jgi:NTP pyrophosphatase (non-canonical NTP hydrolase)
MTFGKYQKEVDEWIKQHTVGYWSPHEILTRLAEEVGELAKEINHKFGLKKKKPGEGESSIEDECGDVIFTIVCLLNSQKLNLDRAFKTAMSKCYGRDKDRFKRID